MYHSQTIKTKGRVDHQNSHLDTHPLEKKRGITIFTDQAILKYQGDKYFLLDTPGHIDFSPEMERTLKVLDYLIIIVSAVEGIEGHTERVWELAAEESLPVFFFINKCDRKGAGASRILTELKNDFSQDIFHIPALENEMPDSKLIEFSAERNEKLLKLYLAEKLDKEIFLQEIKKMIQQRKIFMAASGSALNDSGVKEFFGRLSLLTETFYQKKEEEQLQALLYKISHDQNQNRISHIKVLSGSLQVRDELEYQQNDRILKEKITEMRFYSGRSYQNTDQVKAGEIAGVLGLTEARVGTTFGKLDNQKNCKQQTALKTKVIYADKVNTRKLLEAFKILEAEDPSLNIAWNSKTKEIQVNVMGRVQLEILKSLVKQRFGYQIDFARPNIIYKETIKGKVKGYGHFEPLKHYAEVHLQIEAAPRNSGIIFENRASIDDLSKGLQNLIKQHILEKEHRGILTGSPLTDLKITLLTGRAHQKHTSGGDFKEATYRALRQGLEKANNLLLEPFYEFKIKVELNHLGRVISDIEKANGSFSSPVIDGDQAVIKGKAPAANFEDYPVRLRTFTGGRGIITLKFYGYDTCHNKLEVIDASSYDKNNDPEYPSSSIFCARGKGYTVSWDQVESEMHLL
ncbi:small GTP-binding protein domain-containing protein [Halanaerobium kushneri]|jgi:small GTP-binding protein|uniref:Small GTP-binding protein domain-containing protein n=2 Tax=Halanaerobium kushneri TaxID=56779 RepID=A0A1N7BS36_9FIRM|nr:small GTP-binding protein domain-containing protein [Halanaerobium kushneri]